MTDVSVILPTYNERENIEDLVSSIKSEGDFEIIVVDDSSPDGTWKAVGSMEEQNGSVRLLKRETRGGIASAIADGISIASGDIVVWMDSDFSMPPETIPHMVKAMRESDIVVASRYVEGARDLRPFNRVLASRLLNLYAGFMLGHSITDYTSGFIAAKKSVVEEVGISTNGHGEYNIVFLYRAKKAGFKIVEVPHICSKRRAGKTKTFPSVSRVFRHAFIYLSTVIKVRLKK